MKLVFLLCLAVFLVVSRPRRRMTSGQDFALAGRTFTAAQVAWVIIGTLVGGASTIGTVQLAVSYGLAAWIFTLGSGISCLVLGLFFARALREAEAVTVSEFIAGRFGPGLRRYSSFFMAAGMFVQVVAQILAAIAVLMPVLECSRTAGFLTATLLVGGFVVLGGMSGSNTLGRIKFFLLVFTLVLGGAICLRDGGGLSGIIAALPEGEWGSLFAYGAGRGSMDIIAMVIGVISTQTYLQALFAAKDVRAARNGALLSAALIPPLGLLGVLIGLYIRAHHPELAANSAEALPRFILENFHPLIAGICFAGLLLASLGTAAGLVLGTATTVFVDLMPRRWTAPAAGQAAKGALRFLSGLTGMRLVSIAVLIGSALLVLTGMDSAILRWGYMSMGLRGTAVFALLCLCVFTRRRSFPAVVHWGLYALPAGYLLWGVVHGI